MIPFGTAVMAGDMTAMAGLLHPDATFTSPAVFQPYRGRAAVLRVLTAATQTIEDFAYTGEAHGPGMDVLRFLPPDDPRIRATVLAIADELTQDGLVLRYQVDETDDGLSGEEGTFTICSFWLVSALTEIGEHQRARDICEKVLSYASPLLLYGEEIDPRSGRHLGNFPQAFTHLALINAVMHVIRKEQAAQRQAMGREVPEGHG